MPASDILYIPNQPIQFYKIIPGPQDLAMAQRRWDKTAYHKRLGNCYFDGPLYCHPVDKNLDFLTFQFKAATTGFELFNTAFAPLCTGTNDSVVPGFLEDSTATFFSNGVELGAIVINTTTNTSSYVIDASIETEIELQDDIFLATPNDYEVWSILVTGNWRYDNNGNYFYMASPAIGATITFPTMVGIGTWYRMVIELRNVTSGSVDVFLGTNNIATLNSNGVHVIYGQCTGSTDLTIVADGDFVGRIMGETYLEIFALETLYTFGIFDTEDNYIGLFTHTETSDSLTIGNVFINQGVDHLGLDCGNYVLALYEANPLLCYGVDLIFNGDFDTSAGWSTDPDINITGGHVEFNGPSSGSLCQTIDCPIIQGHTYHLRWAIAGGGSGSYAVTLGGQQISPSYNVALQSGFITLDFTAPNSSSTICFIVLGPSTFVMDRVSMVDTTPPILDIEDADGASECLCICDNHECTALVTFEADQPTFGNYFDSNSPVMMMRVTGRLRNDETPDIELNAFKSTLDLQIQPYMNLGRNEDFATGLCPAWVHNSIAIALSHPIMLIDGVSYKRTGAYSVNWGDDIELAAAACKLTQENQESLRNNY